MPTIPQIVSAIAAKEGRKHEAPVGDIREIVSIISDMVFDDDEVANVLKNNGRRRAKKRVK